MISLDQVKKVNEQIKNKSYGLDRCFLDKLIYEYLNHIIDRKNPKHTLDNIHHIIDNRTNHQMNQNCYDPKRLSLNTILESIASAVKVIEKCRYNNAEIPHDHMVFQNLNLFRKQFEEKTGCWLDETTLQNMFCTPEQLEKLRKFPCDFDRWPNGKPPEGK